MELIWCGTASLILREQDTVIAFDPFGKLPIHGLSEKTYPVLHEEEYREATDVFVTHGHFDHIYHIPQIYRGRKVRIYCTDAPMKTLEKHGIPDMEIVRIAPGWCGEVGAFRITAYQGRHCKFDLPMVFDILRRPSAWRHFFYSVHLATMSLEYPENQEILFFEVRVKLQQTGISGARKRSKPNPNGKTEERPEPNLDGRTEERPEPNLNGGMEERSKAGSQRRSERKEADREERAAENPTEKEPDFRIQIMGSMNLDPSVTYQTGADVLILPLQGRSDQDEYALQFVERLRPKLVLLDHYDNAFPPISQDVDVSGFVKNVEERLHIPCRPMKEGEVLLFETE